jgi:hypothetical protein
MAGVTLWSIVDVLRKVYDAATRDVVAGVRDDALQVSRTHFTLPDRRRTEEP